MHSGLMSNRVPHAQLYGKHARNFTVSQLVTTTRLLMIMTLLCLRIGQSTYKSFLRVRNCFAIIKVVSGLSHGEKAHTPNDWTSNIADRRHFVTSAVNRQSPSAHGARLFIER